MSGARDAAGEAARGVEGARHGTAGRSMGAAFVAGVLFALGLGVSGMTKPTKVVAFLDVAGKWDPSLAFVMLGAIGVYGVAGRIILRRATPLAGGAFAEPSRTAIDAPLVLGAACFGVGWALGGFCPGPAIVSVGSGSGQAAAAPSARCPRAVSGGPGDRSGRRRPHGKQPRSGRAHRGGGRLDRASQEEHPSRSRDGLSRS